jgi:aspartyl-tRNA(Asn)/glutamyl-tRNA(Gln) amidotransferase subunit A
MKQITSRQVSPVELVQTYLDRIDRWDDSLRSYITVCRDEALEAAREAEAAVTRGDTLGPLHGIPIGLKDQMNTKGIKTTGGTRILAEYVPDEDATVVTRLKEAGAIILGKQNLTEFAIGGTVDFPYGEPRNPWNQEHTPGGSSAGSGIAPAAGLCAAAIGEDTGGSIRSPASNNGIVGLRPSWGRVSRYGVVPLVWSLDTAGPMTHTVEDCALILQVIAGYDPRDYASANLPVPDYRASLDGDIKGMRVGIIHELLESDFIDPEVQKAVKDAANLLGSLGASVEEVSLPMVNLAGRIYPAICDAEFASLHRKWLAGRPEDYDRLSRRRMLTASLIPLPLYYRAQQVRNLIRNQVLEACQRFDVLLSPFSATPPGLIEDGKLPISNKEDGVRRLMQSNSSSPFVLSATPAMALPCGFTEAGLPIGLQLAADRFNETAIFRVAHAYERNTDWHTKRPPLP